MTWGPNEHIELLQGARYSIDLVSGLTDRLLTGQTYHLQHAEMAGRAKALGERLNAALQLALVDSYLASFSLLRTAMEHQLLDELIFLGRRHIQIIGNVSDEQWERWQAERAAGMEWAQDVVELTRLSRSKVRVVREGLNSEPDENGRCFSLSIYYFLREHYNPLAPRPSEVDRPTQTFAMTADAAIKGARNNRDLYEVYLRWQSIKENLQLNGFFDEESIKRLDVHYRFLSSYVHPLTDRIAATYGRNANWPCYDHYSSELILLYVLTLASREIRSFCAMCELEPVVDVSGVESLVAGCQRFDALSNHLWFPGHSHHSYDQFASDNRRDFEGWRLGRELSGGAPLYYDDPLDRLIRLHNTVQEMMTGRVYTSPWPRADAARR